MARGIKENPTPMQERAITLIKANVLKPRKRYQDKHPVTKCLLDAGYSPESARQYSNIMRGLKPHLQETIDWMKEHRLRVAAHMEKQITKADYADLTKAFNVLTENLQLLEGKPTQNIAVISKAHRDNIDKLIAD